MQPRRASIVQLALEHEAAAVWRLRLADELRGNPLHGERAVPETPRRGQTPLALAHLDGGVLVAKQAGDGTRHPPGGVDSQHQPVHRFAVAEGDDAAVDHPVKGIRLDAVLAGCKALPAERAVGGDILLPKVVPTPGIQVDNARGRGAILEHQRSGDHAFAEGHVDLDVFTVRRQFDQLAAAPRRHFQHVRTCGQCVQRERAVGGRGAPDRPIRGGVFQGAVRVLRWAAAHLRPGHRLQRVCVAHASGDGAFAGEGYFAQVVLARLVGEQPDEVRDVRRRFNAQPPGLRRYEHLEVAILVRDIRGAVKDGLERRHGLAGGGVHHPAAQQVATKPQLYAFARHQDRLAHARPQRLGRGEEPDIRFGLERAKPERARFVRFHSGVAQRRPGVQRTVRFGVVHALVLVPLRGHCHAGDARAVDIHHLTGHEMLLGERYSEPVRCPGVDVHGTHDANMPVQGRLHQVQPRLQAGDANRSFAVGVPNRPLRRRHLRGVSIAGEVDRHIQQRGVEPRLRQRVEHGAGFRHDGDARAGERRVVVRADADVQLDAAPQPQFYFRGRGPSRIRLALDRRGSSDGNRHQQRNAAFCHRHQHSRFVRRQRNLELGALNEGPLLVLRCRANNPEPDAFATLVAKHPSLEDRPFLRLPAGDPHHAAGQEANRHPTNHVPAQDPSPFDCHSTSCFATAIPANHGDPAIPADRRGFHDRATAEGRAIQRFS